MRIFGTILIGIWIQLLAAQSPAYLHYTVRDGLPGNLVYCGLQDHRGLLWFGTDKGLACFDGTRFHVYGISDGLPDPEVLNMQEDSKGRLWLFCFRKKPCYMLGGRIITEKQDSLLGKIDFGTGTYILTEQDKQNFWLTELSKRVYHSDNKDMVPYDFPREVITIRKMGGENLVMGLRNIMRMLPDGTVETIYEIDTHVGFQSMGISGNRILYTYTDRIVLLEYKHRSIRVLWEGTQPIGQVYVDKLGRFWVCSPALGAVLFNNARRDLTNPDTLVAGKKVFKMFEDNQGMYWFCTANEGVFGLHKNAPLIFQKDAGMTSLNIRAIGRNNAGHVFAGNDAGVIYVISGEKVIQTVSTGAVDGYNHIRQIIPDGAGAFCFASDDGLGYYYDQYRRKSDYSIASLKSMVILRDTIWYAAATAFSFYDYASGQNHVVKGSRTTSVACDDDNCIWIGKVDGLCSRLDSFMFNWGDSFPDLKRRILRIQNAGNHQLWVVTPDNGLILATVHAGTITRVQRVNDHLATPIENIQSLYVEPGGKVWMATNKGVYGMTRDWRVVHYSTNDGLADDDVNAVFAFNDTLWAGTVSGLARMVLKAPEEKGEFLTLITGLQYDLSKETSSLRLLDSVNSNRQIILPAESANVAISLAGLDYLSRGNLRYEIVQTQLLLPFRWWTFDNLISWIASGFEGQKDTALNIGATYNLGASVAPGKYRIQATALKPSGIQSQFPDTWILVKKPFWYESFWLYLLLWCALGYGVYRIYKARVAYREINAAASALQLQALQSQMNPHFIGNAVNAIQQFLHPPDPVKTSEYIAIFMRLLRRTMDFSEQTFIPFDEEMSYDQEYLQLVQLRFENKFRYTISGIENVPPETPIPSMLLQPILENATIHGLAPEGDSILTLEFVYNPQKLSCILTDNGIGLKESQRQKQALGMKRKSRGLTLLRKKVESLNVLYAIDLTLSFQDLSAQGTGRQGTRVIVSYNPSKVWKSYKPVPAQSDKE